MTINHNTISIKITPKQNKSDIPETINHPQNPLTSRPHNGPLLDPEKTVEEPFGFQILKSRLDSCPDKGNMITVCVYVRAHLQRKQDTMRTRWRS